MATRLFTLAAATLAAVEAKYRTFQKQQAEQAQACPADCATQK
jgi:hypothetical protein